MPKSKQEFLEKMHEKVFYSWWEENQFLFPLVHTSQERKIFIAGRLEMENQFIKQKRSISKVERERRNLQSKMDKEKIR